MKKRFVAPLLMLCVTLTAESALGLDFVIKGATPDNNPIPLISADYRFNDLQHQAWGQWSRHSLNNNGIYTFTHTPSSVETKWESHVYSDLWIPEIPRTGYFDSGFSTASDRTHRHILVDRLIYSDG